MRDRTSRTAKMPGRPEVVAMFTPPVIGSRLCDFVHTSGHSATAQQDRAGQTCLRGGARTRCPLWHRKRAAACEESETRGTVAEEGLRGTEVRRWARP